MIVSRAADAALAVYDELSEPLWSVARVRLNDRPLTPQIYIDDQGQQYIAIQGTTKLSHWLTNLSAWRSDWGKWSVHAGFADTAGEILHSLDEHVKSGFIADPVLCGHSLGGVVAMLIASRIRITCDVVAFGMPKTGAGPDLAQSIPGDVVRVQNGMDAVPRRPIWRRYDGGDCLYIDTDGNQAMNPSIWYRFKDRALILARWRKITDHYMAGYHDDLTKIGY